ncbi:MAG: PAS domain-containing protein [Chthoniobacterales bacterium]|nr:PAS domain-containing protein [Chthoniobacterales bacterium]
MKSGFLDKLIGRLGKIGPEDVQHYLLRLAREKGLIETVFNAIQEGIIVTDAKGRITYVNVAACELFGFEADQSIGKRLDERVRGLDWKSLSGSEDRSRRDLSRQSCFDQRIRRLRRSVPGQRRSRAHLGARGFPRQAHRRRRESRRDDLGEMHRHRRQRPREAQPESRAERAMGRRLSGRRRQC